MPKSKRSCLSPGDTMLNDRYEVLKVIHTTGMANIYLVSDRKLNKQWCAKEIIKSESGKNMVEYRSLLQDANILSSLNHSAIPRITTREDDSDGRIFIVMDYVEGLSIKEWIQRKGAIDQSVAVSWLKQVCSVLIYLHNRENPIFYRDMKPDNIMVQDDGSIKLLDFGISVELNDKNRIIEEALGTPGYAAPEQSKRGNPYDLRSDIYSLGVTMYHMLTGVRPASVKDRTPMRQINSDISVGLEKIVDKCLQPNPNDRYQSVEEVLYDLENHHKLDARYTAGLKRKVKISVGLLVISLLLMIGSIIPYWIGKAYSSEKYDELVRVAAQTGRSEDYIEAITLKPLELSPYVGLIDSYKTDGVFSKEEEGALLNLINPNLEDLKKQANYGQLAYNIGKLYWFYYEGTDGDTVSSRWFKEAMDNNFSKADAKVYYDLGSFKKNISMAITEASDSGMYKTYWNNLIKSKDIDSGEVIELQVYNSIADVIKSYAYRLKVDGVPKSSVEAQVKDIGDYLKVAKPVSEKSVELYNQLKSKYKGLDDIVDVAYSQGGGK